MKFGVLLLTLDVFFTFSRTLEFFPVKAGPLSLAVAIRFLGVIFAVLSGGIFLLLQSKIAKCMLFFTAWMILGIPFSSWKGGSVDSVLHEWLPCLCAFVAAAVLIYSVGSARTLMFTLAFSNLAILVFSRTYGSLDITNSRLEVGEGSLGNSNDLASMLLIGLPCMVLYIQDNKGRRWLGRLIMLAGIPLLFLIVSQTGSRSGFLTITAYATMLVVSVSGIKKLAIAGGLLVGGVMFFMIAPASTLARYRTILPFLPETASRLENLEESAAASSESRKQLLQMSLEMTIHNPIFGVGVGTFQPAAAKISKSRNEYASWHESHNTYTQVASECGIPAFIAYMAALWFSFQAVWRVRRESRLNPELLSLHRMAGCLLFVLIGYAISAFFASVAYLPAFPFIAAIVVGFQRQAQSEILRLTPAPARATPWMALRTPVLIR